MKGKRKGALMRKFIINALFLLLLRNFINKTIENWNSMRYNTR